MSESADKTVRIRGSRRAAKAKLRKQIAKGRRTLTVKIDDKGNPQRNLPAYQAWYDSTRQLLLNLFTTDAMEQEFVSKVRFNYRMYVWEHFPQFGSLESRDAEIEWILGAVESVMDRLPLLEEDVKTAVTTSSREVQEADKRKVFVVHGRDTGLKNSMFKFLAALKLIPLEWDELIKGTQKGSPYIGEILDTAFGQAQAILVLLTGDDEAKLQKEFIKENDHPYEKELTPQARPNVLFEAGMAVGKCEDRTILVQIGKLRPWSDIAGRHITHLDDTQKKRRELLEKLRATGCEVNGSDNRWKKVGNFRVKPSAHEEEALETDIVPSVYSAKSAPNKNTTIE